MIRMPAVAGQFYPGTPDSLRKSMAALVPELAAGMQRQQAIAVVSPHAGYVYSGGVAGQTFSRVNVPEAVVILGPNHTGYGEPVAMMAEGVWQMPMGDVPMNRELARSMTAVSSVISVDSLAHQREHSLEVQVPFLQHLQANLSITPLVISHLSYELCVDVGQDIATAIRNYGKPVLIVASTDMTHYESRESAGSKDRLALERIRKLDPEGLYRTVVGKRISMCGIMPTTIALIAAINLGAQRAELVRYTDSGEASGDTRQVVGYAGLVIS